MKEMKEREKVTKIDMNYECRNDAVRQTKPYIEKNQNINKKKLDVNA